MAHLVYTKRYFLVRPDLRNYLFLIILFIFSGLSGQHSNNINQFGNNEELIQDDVESLDEYVHLNQELPSEKIFLHLDRPGYMLGDTIWFKAYLWHGYDQVPDTLSGILYLDLISSRGGVLLKRKYLIQNGTCYGDFTIDSTIAPGSYHLLAYTRMMHESGLGEPFNQAITIYPSQQNVHFECIPVILKQSGDDSLQIKLKYFEIDPSGSLNSLDEHKVNYSLKIGDSILQEGLIPMINAEEHILTCKLTSLSSLDSLADLEITILDDRVTYEHLFHIPLQEYIDLQFFPEGGTLITGLESKVAFKAIGPDGLSREVSGEIRTKDDSVVTSFSSTHKGMGTFMLKPHTNHEYAAHILFNKRKYIIPLPAASAEGLAMSVTYPDGYDDPYVSIRQNRPGITESKYIVGSAFGKIWFSAIVKAFRDSSTMKIPVDLLPEGICRLTVLNEDFKPESERLIYINKDQGFEIEVSPDSSSYEQRSRVTLKINATSFGWDAVQADLSIAVLDREQVSHNTLQAGIKAYQLLNSELQGYIEDADRYYENGSWAKVNLLDLLLLTQGYRKFAPVGTTGDDMKFQAEKSLDITGKIEFTGSKAREKKYNYQNIELTLLSYSDNYYVQSTYPDSLGNFRFRLPLMHGRSRMVLQATTARGKPFKGDIFVDDQIAPPQYSSMQLDNKKIASTTEDYVKQLRSKRMMELSKPLFPDSVAWNMSLEEVQVTAKAKDWYRRYEHDARKIIDLDTLDPDGNKYEDLYDLLVKEFGAKWKTVGFIKTVLLPCVKTSKLPYQKMITHFPPIYLIDGETYWNGKGFNFWPLQALAGYPANEIKRIIVMPPNHNGVMYYASKDIYGRPLFISQSMVVIESYSGNTYRGNAQGIKTFILDGLDAPREFYSPRYEGPTKTSEAFDGRATLFWEPSVRTDSNGEATLEFYTSDRQTAFDVIINGIKTESGYPGQGHAQIIIRSGN